MKNTSLCSIWKKTNFLNKNKNKNKNIYLSFLAIHTALMITANMFELYDVIVWALMDANST
jgi:hypothetical protein